MGRTKDLFMMMREREVVTDNFFPSKRDLTKTAKDFAKEIIDKAEHNPQEIYAQARRLLEVFSILEKEFKSKLPQEDFEAFGIRGTYRDGGDRINYSEDDVVRGLEQRLKERKELIKAAMKTSQPIYDSDGVEVSKVSTTPRKSTLAITF